MRFPRLLIAMLVVWPVAIAVNNPVFAQSDAEIALREARAAFEAEQWEKARDLLIAASQTDAKNPDIFLLLGKAHYQLGEVEPSMAAWRRTLALAPQHAYARKMIEALDGTLRDVDTRLRVVESLLAERLLVPARDELSRLAREPTLSNAQRQKRLQLQAALEIRAGQGAQALRMLHGLVIRYPEQEKTARVALLRGQAQVIAGGDLIAVGLESLKKTVADFADTPEAAEAELTLVSYRVAQGSAEVTELTQWIEAHPDHTAISDARRQLTAAIDRLIASNQHLPAAKPDGPLSDPDKQALAIAAAQYPSFVSAAEALKLTERLIKHLEDRYVGQQAFAAATAGLKTLQAAPLPPSSRAALGQAVRRLNEATASAGYVKIVFELDQGATDTTALTAWIQAHPDHPLIPEARRRVVLTHLSAARKGDKPKPNAALSETDLAALAAANEAFAAFQQPGDAVALTREILKYFEEHYAKNKAYEAALAGIEALRKASLPPASVELTAAALKRTTVAETTTEYEEIATHIRHGSTETKDLLKWLESNPQHPMAAAARRLLVNTYLAATRNAAAPTETSQLSGTDAAALEASANVLKDIKDPAESLKFTQQLISHLQDHYVKRRAHTAAITGIQRLLGLELPATSRSSALAALAGVQSGVAVEELTRNAQAGRLQPGPLPASLAAVLKTLARINTEFPANPTWDRQANLVASVAGLDKHVPWPAEVTQLKLPHSWALEMALPVIKADIRSESAAKCISLVAEIAKQYSDLKQDSAHDLALSTHAKLLTVVPQASQQWPPVLLHHAKLLQTKAEAAFHNNVRTGRGAENAKLSDAQTELIARLSALAKSQPALADQAFAALETSLKLWLDYGHYDVVEQAYDTLAANLPAQQQNTARLAVARLWIRQVTEQDSRQLAAGFEIPHKIDPMAVKALTALYDVQRGLSEQDPVVGQAQSLRGQIVDHYKTLEYYDVAMEAIATATEPAIDAADAHAELQHAGLLADLARRELSRQLTVHKGRENLALLPSFGKAVDAYKTFITQRPTNPAVPAAIEAVFGIGRLYESHEAFLVAAQVYRDIEKFAAEQPALAAAKPNVPSTAERAALAAAVAMHQRATSELAKSRSELAADAPPPEKLSEPFEATIAAYREILTKYPQGPIAGTAVRKILAIGLQYAVLDAWDVADSVYAGFIDAKLALREPERLEMARALCQLGKVLPDHAREMLQTMSSSTRHSAADSTNEMLAVSGARPGTSQGGAHDHSSAGDAAAPSRTETPAADGRSPNEQPADPLAPTQIAEPKPDDEQAARDADLLAAVRRQNASLASRIAMLQDTTLQFRSREIQPAQQQGEVQNVQQQVKQPVVPVLSDAEIARRSQALDAAYTGFQQIRKNYSDTPTAAQARAEIMLIIGHWRSIGQWQRAAGLAQRFLTDNPLDAELPQLRHAIARDFLAWAAQGVKLEGSKQEKLDEVRSRFDQARSELSKIVADFADEKSLRHKAQWDIARSYLNQARVVAGFSPTLARGQYVRSAFELLNVADRYHNHPQINSIPQMLWNISEELFGRGFYDESITVWNQITIHYPMHQLGMNAPLRIAQTYQQQLGQPLRAVEAYIELNFSRGGADASLQNAVLQIATDLKNKKRWVEALHVLQTFVDTFPHNAQAGQALTMVGQVHQFNEAWKDAIAVYERVMQEYPQGNWVQEARWSIAECTINLSRWKDASDLYHKYVNAYPKDQRVAEANRRIETLKDLARYQKVVDEQGQRKAFDAQYQIGSIVHHRLSNPVKGIIEYRKVAEKWPDSHLADDALYQVGLIYLKSGETEKAREALLAVAEKYPSSPLADDALYQVGTSYENEAQQFAAVTRDTSIAEANDLAQRQAYQLAQENRRFNVGRGQKRLSDLKKAGKLEEADKEVAVYAARNMAYDFANAQVLSNWASQQAEVLTAAQMADRQDKINAALRRAVDSFRRASVVPSGDKADDALLRMAQIYDERLNDADAAMKTWLEIVRQFSGTTVAEDASWKIAKYYEQEGQYAKAVEAFQAFLRNYRRSPKAGTAQVAIAENFENLGRWVEAMDAYTNYLNNFPEGPQMNRAKEQIAWIKTYRL